MLKYPKCYSPSETHPMGSRTRRGLRFGEAVHLPFPMPHLRCGLRLLYRLLLSGNSHIGFKLLLLLYVVHNASEYLMMQTENQGQIQEFVLGEHNAHDEHEAWAYNGR